MYHGHVLDSFRMTYTCMSAFHLCYIYSPPNRRQTSHLGFKFFDNLVTISWTGSILNELLHNLFIPAMLHLIVRFIIPPLHINNYLLNSLPPVQHFKQFLWLCTLINFMKSKYTHSRQEFQNHPWLFLFTHFSWAIHP